MLEQHNKAERGRAQLLAALINGAELIEDEEEGIAGVDRPAQDTSWLGGDGALMIR